MRADTVVRPLMVGICGTDLDILRGDRPETIPVVGHEGYGRIERATLGGPYEVGDLVVFNPVNQEDPDDVLGHSKPGLLQPELIVGPDELAMLVPMEPGLAPRDGPLAEPLATVIYGHSLVSAATDQREVAIVGAGSIGCLHALHARLCGAATVLLLDRDPARLEWAVANGIVRPGEAILLDPLAADRVLASTGGRGVDAAYLCVSRAGAQELLDLVVRITRDGGCIDLVSGFPDGTFVPSLPGVDLNAVRRADTCGVPRSAPPTTVRTAYGARLVLVGHRGTSAGHLREAMRLLRAHAGTFRPIVTHVVGFADLNGILARVAHRERTFGTFPATKILVRMDG